jgi:hypothetical protein
VGGAASCYLPKSPLPIFYCVSMFALTAFRKLPRSALNSRRLFGVVSKHQQELPWTVVQPFGSIKVDLTEAFAGGWERTDDFPAQLQSKA